MSPHPTSRSLARVVATAVLCTALAVGCAEKSPEELLQDATQELSKATQVRDAAKQTLDQLDERLEQAREARETAFEAYQESVARWEEANERVGEYATDEVLHHQINQALLDEPGLKSSTIQARVNLRVVTLVGDAGSQEAIDRAIDIAEDVPGVVSVTSQVDHGPARRTEQVAAPGPEREPDVTLETEAEPEPEPAPGPEPTDAPDADEAVVEEETPADTDAATDEPVETEEGGSASSAGSSAVGS